MTKITPPDSVQKFISLDEDLSTTIATALWKQAAQLVAYMNQSVPVGTIIWFRDTQTGSTTPDPKYWQEMNNSPVTNTLSPFYNIVLPDLRNAYIKHPGPGQGQNEYDGTDALNLSHNHGGWTGYGTDVGAFNADNNDDEDGPTYHRHPIPNALTTPIDIKPLFFGYRLYLRIV